MKNIITLALTGLFLLASVPAFACEGHKAAKSDDGDTLMTSADDGEKEADTTKSKKTKKSDKKADEKADEEKTEEAGEA